LKRVRIDAAHLRDGKPSIGSIHLRSEQSPMAPVVKAINLAIMAIGKSRLEAGNLL
jgi:hypothetical protein